jgi:hypothetical protein
MLPSAMGVTFLKAKRRTNNIKTGIQLVTELKVNKM